MNTNNIRLLFFFKSFWELVDEQRGCITGEIPPLTNLGSAHVNFQTTRCVHEEGLTRRPNTRAEFGICGERDLRFAS